MKTVKKNYFMNKKYSSIYPDEQTVVPRFSEENGFFTTPNRSALMGKIKSQDTKPELKLRRALWNLGFRYRKNVKKLPGAPDIVFLKSKLAIFIDGEFWHGYNWEVKKQSIKSNPDYWIPKIEKNMQRDIMNERLLQESGWITLRLWEHEIKENIDRCINKIIYLIRTRRNNANP